MTTRLRLGRASLALMTMVCIGPRLSGQAVIPLLDCVEPMPRSTGVTQLVYTIPAGVSTATFAQPVPGYSTLTFNPGGPNQETTARSNTHINLQTFSVNLAYAHVAGEPVRWDVDGAHIAHFGYFNPTGNDLSLIAGGSSNFFSPGNPDRGQPSVFPPGMQKRGFSVAFLATRDLIWILGTQLTIARGTSPFLCADSSTVPSIQGRTITVPAGSSTPGVVLATAAVPRDPSASLIPSIQALWLGPAPTSEITVVNPRFQNGAILGDLNAGSARPARYTALLSASSPAGATGYGTATVDVRNLCSLNVTPASLPLAVQGMPYTPVALAATGGTAPYSFSLESATQPPGMTFANGVLSGTPTMTGTYPLPLLVTDAGSCMARVDYALTVAGAACAVPVTSQVQVSLGGFRRNLVTNRWIQVVTLRNAGASAIAGPVALVLDGLSANATVFNPSGVTSCAAPLGRQFVLVSAGTDNVLSPGETATANLEFVNSEPSTAITYTPRILAGGTQR